MTARTRRLLSLINTFANQAPVRPSLINTFGDRTLIRVGEGQECAIRFPEWVLRDSNRIPDAAPTYYIWETPRQSDGVPEGKYR
jgi:hypothetical protein